MDNRPDKKKNRFTAAGLLILCAAATLFSCWGETPRLFAQGWQVYAEQIKAEAAQKRNQNKKSGQNGDSSENGDSSVLIAASPADLSSESSPPKTSENSVRFQPRRPLPRARLADFTEELGETPPSDEDDATEIPASGSVKKGTLPSYRNFPRMKNDATLNDLFFSSPSRGWVVGDRGTVWTTVDGGGKWLLVHVPTDVNLQSVHFVNEKLGLVVGGSILPGRPNGEGIILRTDDGGRNWSVIETPSFPILRQVRFTDEDHAEAFGDSSELYPSGLFVSRDGGVTWEGLSKANRHPGWKKTLSAADSKTFGVSPNGRFQTFTGNRSETSSLLDETEFFTDLDQSGPNGSLWLVGHRGVVLTSEKGDAGWKRPAAPLPSFAADYFDFESVSVRGDRIRIVGNPGTRLFLSDDGGRSWRWTSTGVTVPIRKIRFFDDQNGWGIGQLGNIIATRDGGETWTVQHEGGRRLAYLGIFTDGDAVPYELLARVSGENGYLGMAALLTHPESDSEREDEIFRPLRLREGVVEAGGCDVSDFQRFERPSDSYALSLETILERFNAENDGKGLDILRERLVRLIRTYRPAALILDDPSVTISATLPAPSPLTSIAPSSVETPTPISSAAHLEIAENGPPLPSVRPVACFGSKRLDPVKLAMMTEHARNLDDVPKNPLDQFIAAELKTAVKNAADPLAYPDHLTQCGLSVWEVEKVHMILKNNNRGNIALQTSDYAPSLGRSVGEIARRARRLVGPSPDAESLSFPMERPRIDLTTLYDKKDQSGGEAKFSTLFAGLNIPYGSDSRRVAPTENLSSAEALAERNSKRKRLLGVADFIESRAKNEQPGTELLFAELGKDLDRLDSELAVDYLLKVGKSFHESGEWTLAENVFSVIASNYPEEPAAREALVWLIQFYSGSEPFWRTQEGNRFEAHDGPIQQVGFTAAASKMTDSTEVLSRLENAEAIGRLIRDLYPELYMDPSVRFPLAVVQRKGGYVKNALNYFLNRSLLMKNDLNGIRAKGEFWLLNRNRAGSSLADRICPLSACSCRVTAQKPYLDGILEPEIWQNADRFSLSQKRADLPNLSDPSGKTPSSHRQEKNARLSTEFGTFVSILYDHDFLYLGIEARKADGFPYPKSGSPRRRDADLSTSDRIEISLDLDRDFATFYRFVVDRHGSVTDSCWGSQNWNARMFVAEKENSGGWSLEIAIPWNELTDAAPGRGDVWGIALRRIVPNVGMEIWNADHSICGENGFGYLTFGAASIRN